MGLLQRLGLPEPRTEEASEQAQPPHPGPPALGTEEREDPPAVPQNESPGLDTRRDVGQVTEPTPIAPPERQESKMPESASPQEPALSPHEVSDGLADRRDHDLMPARPVPAVERPAAPPQPKPRVVVPPSKQQSQKAQVIAFANQKGGVAKTTTTLNLAVAFAEAGHRVLAIDMDL